MYDPEKMALERMGLAGQKALAQLADSNIHEMVAALGKGIAQAQHALDTTSVRIAQMMTGNFVPDENGEPVYQEGGSRVSFGGERLSLLELGFTPTFYQFIETVIEVKMSVSLDADVKVDRREKTTTTTRKTSGFFRRKTKTTVHSVSTRFSASFQYSVEGSSYVRTKLVPVPPPASLLEVMEEAASESAAGRGP